MDRPIGSSGGRLGGCRCFVLGKPLTLRLLHSVKMLEQLQSSVHQCAMCIMLIHFRWQCRGLYM